MNARAPDPSAWVAVVPGKGSCFHQALSRWMMMREVGLIGWRVGLGIVEVNPFEPERHVHAWLEHAGVCVSAPFGSVSDRLDFYCAVGIDASTVRLVSPRKILRRSKGVIDKDTISALLDLWGRPWKVVNGGVLPA